MIFSASAPFLTVLGVIPLLAEAKSRILQSPPTPVGRIVELLQEMKEKIEDEGKEEEDLYETYVCWAKTVISSKTESNAKAKSRIDELEAYIADIDAGRIEFTTERVDLEKEVKELTDGIEKADALRAKEHADYLAAKEEMEKGIAALEEAIGVIEGATSGGASLLRTRSGSGLSFREGVAQGNALMRAIQFGQQFLSPADAYFLQRVLSGDVPKPDWKKLNRKAEFKMKYKARSGEIVDLLNKMLKTFQNNLEEADQKEEAAQKQYDELSEAKQGELEKAQAGLNELSGEGGARGLVKEDSEAEMEDLKAQVKADEGFIEDTTKSLEEKKGEWKERKIVRAEELAAISKAIAILHSDDARDTFKSSFKSTRMIAFIQEGSTTLSWSHRLGLAADKLRKAAKITHNSQLLILAMQVSVGMNGRFDKVIEAIDKMIDKLKEQTEEDAKTVKTCKDERVKDTAEAKSLSDKVDGLSEDIASLKEKIEERIKEIKEKEESIVSLKEELAEATKTREAEHEAWVKSDADDNQAVLLVGEAIDVLKGFYGGLLQLKKGRRLPEVVAGEAPPPPPPTWEKPYEGKKEDGTSVIGMLETVQKDIEKDLEEAKKAEDKAQEEYDKFKKDAEDQIKSLEDAIAQLKEDNATDEESIAEKEKEKIDLKGQLAEVVATIKEKAEQCDWFIKFQESRVEHRKIETEGLEEAKSILEEYDSK